MEYKKMLRALSDVEEQRNISEAVILEALNEAVAKAYKKDAELQDIDVVAELNEKKKKFDLYQNYLVLESDDDVQDDEQGRSSGRQRRHFQRGQIHGQNGRQEPGEGQFQGCRRTIRRQGGGDGNSRFPQESKEIHLSRRKDPEGSPAGRPSGRAEASASVMRFWSPLRRCSRGSSPPRWPRRYSARCSWVWVHQG